MIWIGDEGWSVEKLPDKKRFALLRHTPPNHVTVYAYFQNAYAAKKFSEFLDRIISVERPQQDSGGEG